MINVGVYIVEPEALNFIPQQKYFDFTSLIHACKENGKKIGIYEIPEEAWSDMGEYNELIQMEKRIGGERNV